MIYTVPFIINSKLGSYFDPDAQLFINAAGITLEIEKWAVHNLIVSLKINGLWTKFIAIYLFLGSTLTAAKFNVINPVDSDAAYRLTFPFSATIDRFGIDFNGTTQYADTHINPSVNMTANNCHISYFSRESDSGSIWDMGAQTSGNAAQRLALALQWGGVISVAIYDNSTSGLNPANTDGKGFYIPTRTAANFVGVYKSGIISSSNAGAAGTQPNANIFIGACSNGAAVLNYGKLQCGFASVGLGLSALEAAIFNLIVQTCMASLNR